MPNKLIKGIFAHLISANDASIPSAFDVEARDVYFGKIDLRQTRLNVFYWLYLGTGHLIMRDVILARYQTAPMRIAWTQLLKLFPIGIAVTDAASFYGFPNLRQFNTPRDDDEVEIPFFFDRYESNPVWPAMPSDRSGTVVFFGGLRREAGLLRCRPKS